MVGNLVRNWWAFVLQGVLAIGVGVAAFASPGATLAAFLVVFGVYAIVGGVFEIAGGFSMANGPKWSLVLGGIASIAVGAITFLSPASTAVAATLVVGIYAIAIGVARTYAAYTLGRLGNSWLLGLLGVVSVVFGVLLIAAPGDGVLAVLWLIGYYAIFAGIMAIAFGLRLRGVDENVESLESKLNAASGTTTGTTTGSTTGTTAASH